MTAFKSLCVYLGSRHGASGIYAEAARALGEGMAARGIALVYGGGRVGLMGTLADAVKTNGGEVTGIIPQHLLAVEAGPGPVTELKVVETMHERKAMMAEYADGFLILPGGLGTLDEFFEILTWRQLGLHDKPILIVDVGGYWKPLGQLLDNIAREEFTGAKDAALVRVVDGVDAAFAALDEMSPSEEPMAREKL